MKVLHLITGLDTGGAEMMLYKLLAHTDRERFEPAVVSMRDKGTLGDRIEALGVPLHALNMDSGPQGLRGLWRLNESLHAINPDVVQGWMYHANMAALLSPVLLRRPVPVVWNVRSGSAPLAQEKWSTRAAIRMSGLLARAPQCIMYNAMAGAEAHEAQLSYPEGKRLVIPNGFDLGAYKPDTNARHWLRETLGLPTEAILIGLIGRYHPVKNHAAFLRAVGRLGASAVPVHVVLAGRGTDAGNNELRSQIQAASLEGQVHLLGERADVPRITAGLDVACSASLSEGFPNVVGEAMACGVPCVVTDVGDSAWLVGDDGESVPPGDEVAMAAAFGRLIAAGPEERHAIGERARLRVARLFSMSVVAAQYEALYQQLGRVTPNPAVPAVG